MENLEETLKYSYIDIAKPSIFNTLTYHISWYKNTLSDLTVKVKFSYLCLILSHGPPLYIESRIAIEIKLSLLPSLDNPVYYNKAAKLLKMIGIQPKQAKQCRRLK